jgi:hypothetical protein
VAQNLALREAQGEIQSILRATQGYSGLLRLRTVLHSHSSGLLIYRGGYGHVCSGLEVEMEFGEVRFGVRVSGHQIVVLRCILPPSLICWLKIALDI